MAHRSTLFRWLMGRPQRARQVRSSLAGLRPAPECRYATCDDLIALKAKFPDHCFDGRNSNASNSWGLKEMGNLFGVQKISEIAPGAMLEVGAGYSTFFADNFAQSHEYWMIDDSGFYSEEKFAEAGSRRQNTRFVRGLLGDQSHELPESYFDLVFSISVLEHVPASQRMNVYSDMFRTVKEGGYIVHSIDVPTTREAYKEYECIKSAGFIIPESPDLKINVDHNDGPVTLFEPLNIVFKYYFPKGQEDIWINPRKISYQYPTLLVVGYKERAAF